MGDKRNGDEDLSERDKLLLLVIVSENREIIENEVTDAVANKLRQEYWENIICHKFNAQQNSGVRTTEQLRNLYDSLKRKARKDKSEEKVQIYKTDDGSSTGTVGVVSEKIISNQVTPSSNETDSDPTYYHDTPFTSLETIVSTVPVDVENASTATDTELSEIQETPTQHKYGKRRPKRTLNEVYEKVQDMADSQVKKNKKKLMEMCSESDMKLKICETGLKIKEEELVVRRRKYNFEEEEFSLSKKKYEFEEDDFRLRKKKYELEEEESRLRKAILKVELELAKAKLDNEKHSSV